ncbi:MAG: lasso peptide biosynthesis B2 protein [Microcystaceae cyanobacterium]
MIQAAAEDNNPTILTGGGGSTYCLNQDVFLFVQDGIAQILDFHRGQFYGLDAVGTLMLSRVLESGIEETIAYMTQTYEVTENQVHSDLNQLLQNLAQKKLLVVTGKQRDRIFPSFYQRIKIILNNLFLELLKIISFIIRKLLNPEPSPNHRTVDLLLSLSWLCFRLMGWSRTIALWQHWHQPVKTVDTLRQEEINQTVDSLVREAAAGKLFLPMVCKERALVGYHLLRTFYSLPATLIVGCDRHPFQVHAWVECDNAVITDDAAHCELFIPVVRYS